MDNPYSSPHEGAEDPREYTRDNRPIDWIGLLGTICILFMFFWLPSGPNLSGFFRPMVILLVVAAALAVIAAFHRGVRLILAIPLLIIAVFEIRALMDFEHARDDRLERRRELHQNGDSKLGEGEK